MKLYHGTTKEANKKIQKENFILGKVFLTDRQDIASEYGECVIAVDVNEHELEIDCDLPGQRTLSIESANNYLNTEYDCVQDFLDAGFSVATSKNVYL